MGLRRRSGSRAAGSAAGQAVETAGDTAGDAVGGRIADLAGDTVPKAGAGRKPLTASSAKRMIGVGRAVAPLLAPYALAAAGVARASWDNYRAARMGVAAEQLGAYSGPGGALHARLSRVAAALTELESRGAASPAGTAGVRGAAATTAVDETGPPSAAALIADTRPRLTDLSIAVRAAEQMPSARRRTAYRAIGHELDRIELALLAHLGVPT